MLESVQYRGQHVGVLPNGSIKEPGRTGTGQHAHFRLIQHKGAQVSLFVGMNVCTPNALVTVQETGDISRQMAGLQLTSPLLVSVSYLHPLVLEGIVCVCFRECLQMGVR